MFWFSRCKNHKNKDQLKGSGTGCVLSSSKHGPWTSVVGQVGQVLVPNDEATLTTWTMLDEETVAAVDCVAVGDDTDDDNDDCRDENVIMTSSLSTDPCPAASPRKF